MSASWPRSSSRQLAGCRQTGSRAVRALCSSASVTAAEARSSSPAGTSRPSSGDTLTVAFGAPVAKKITRRAPCTRLSRSGAASPKDFGGALRRVGIDTGVLSPAARRPWPEPPSSRRRGSRSGAGAGAILVGERAHALRPRARLRVRRRARHDERAGAPARADGPPSARGLGDRARRPCRRARPRSVPRTERRASPNAVPRLVTVAGDAGVGKSRLVRELWDELAHRSRAGADGPRGSLHRRTAAGSRTGRSPTFCASSSACSRRTRPRRVLAAARRRRDRSASSLGLEADAELHPLAAREPLARGWSAFLGRARLGADRSVVLARGSPLGPGAAARPRSSERSTRSRGPLLLVCTARPELLEQHPAWGRRRNAETVWLEPLARRRGASACSTTCAAADVPRGGRARSLRRARRGKPVLPRGAARQPGRAARSGGAASPGHRARRPRGPDRPASADREGRAAGGRRDRPRLLARPGARAARRRRPRLRPARGARLRPAAAGLRARGRARAHVPARADARGRVRGRSRSRAVRASMPRSPPGSSGSGTAAASMPPCSRTTTPRPHGPRTPTWPGPATTPSWSGCARRPSPGSAGPPSSRSGATSSTRRSRCCTARSSSSRSRRAELSLWRADRQGERPPARRRAVPRRR